MCPACRPYGARDGGGTLETYTAGSVSWPRAHHHNSAAPGLSLWVPRVRPTATSDDAGHDDLVPRQVIADLRPLGGDDHHGLGAHPALAVLALDALDGDDHALLDLLGVLQGPLAVDDRVVVVDEPRADVDQSDAVGVLDGEQLGLVVVPELAGRGEVRRGIGGRAAGPQLADYRVEPVAQFVVPALLLPGWRAPDDELAVHAGGVPEERRPAGQHVGEIPVLDAPVAAADPALKRQRPRHDLGRPELRSGVLGGPLDGLGDRALQHTWPKRPERLHEAAGADG